MPRRAGEGSQKNEDLRLYAARIFEHKWFFWETPAAADSVRQPKENPRVARHRSPRRGLWRSG